MGVDFGTRRVGVAVSESDVLATPHSVIPNRGDVGAVFDAIARIADEVLADRIVLGIPKSRRADAERTARRYAELAEKLRQRTCKPVVLWDESLTTIEAEQQLRQSGRGTSQIDMHAAAVILQSWLDEQSRRRR